MRNLRFVTLTRFDKMHRECCMPIEKISHSEFFYNRGQTVVRTTIQTNTRIIMTQDDYNSIYSSILNGTKIKLYA